MSGESHNLHNAGHQPPGPPSSPLMPNTHCGMTDRNFLTDQGIQNAPSTSYSQDVDLAQQWARSMSALVSSAPPSQPLDFPGSSTSSESSAPLLSTSYSQAFEPAEQWAHTSTSFDSAAPSSSTYYSQAFDPAEQWAPSSSSFNSVSPSGSNSYSQAPYSQAPGPAQQGAHSSTSFNAFAPQPQYALPQAPPPAIANAQGFDAAGPGPNNMPTPGPSRARGQGVRSRGEARRGQPKPRDWTADEEQALMRLHAEGYSKQQIAGILGKSRSAVEGKKWRLEGGDPKAYKNNGGNRGGRGGRGGGGGRGGRGGSGGFGIAA